LVNKQTGGGTYTFVAKGISGALRVYMWWTQISNRCTYIPVQIYDGSTLIDTIHINQQTDGGKWNLIGNYTFSGIPKVVIISQGDTCGTNADAARFN
jgi:hypothetical protein